MGSAVEEKLTEKGSSDSQFDVKFVFSASVTVSGHFKSNSYKRYW